MCQLNAKMIRAAMRSAANTGFDPRNSHGVQKRVFMRTWRMEAGRRAAREARSEAAANRWLEEAMNDDSAMSNVWYR